jgi:dTDP-4-dehydrorhamnose 3,5-epimerase
MEFRFKLLEVPDVVLIKAEAAVDHRGFLSETFRRSAFEAEGLPGAFVQENHSHSEPGVLRGLHYQNPPRAAGKLVSVARGEIFDVAVDIRKGSPTFGRAVTQTLSAENQRMLWIPRGFAHGFCVIGAGADVVYRMDEEFSLEHDRGILWSDPTIGIQWPISDPVLSDKDASLPLLGDADNAFRFDSSVQDARADTGVRTHES